MKLLFADYETYYNTKDGYTLRKLTPAEYILDPRFEAIGCAFQWGLDGKPFWVEGKDLQLYFDGLTTDVLMVSHNTLFDGCINFWKYGYLPRLLACTMAMSKATLRHGLKSMSLDSITRHLGFPITKGNAVHKVDGMCLAAIKQAGFYDEYVDYALNDCTLCSWIFRHLATGPNPLFPRSELQVMDMVLRAAIEPKFKLDQNLLAEHLAEVQAEKAQLLAQATGVGADGKSDLMSNERFAQLLRNQGVTPPMKISPTTGKTTYAFAKNDVAFLELAEHENPAVQVLVEARLGSKSTLEETRTQRYITASCLDWPKHLAGTMPMPLGYANAHTHRLGGEWKWNVQNMRRGGKLRRALMCGEDEDVLTVDAAQIEARLVVTLSGQDDVVLIFEQGGDTYAALASEIFGFPVNKKDHPVERFVGKQGRLGLGYQLGWVKFQARLKTDSQNQLGKMISLTDEEAANVVKTFRRTNYKVVNAWNELQETGIYFLLNGGKWDWGPFEFGKGEIIGPNGLKLYYSNLQQDVFDDGKRSFHFTYAGNKHFIYGGKLMENLCQFAARIHTMDAAVRIQRRAEKELGWRYGLAQQAHDENVFIVKKAHTPAMKQIMREEMCRRPAWLPNLPLDCEIGVGRSYGDAK